MSDKLTPEQIENWRKALAMMLGPYARIMPEEDIQKYRDKMQERAEELEPSKKENNESRQ